MLLAAGFASVDIVLKEASRDFIKEWIPGSGAEDYIVSANITAWKGSAPTKATTPAAGSISVESSCCDPATPPVQGDAAAAKDVPTPESAKAGC
jgi:hypothetical protein